MNKSSTRLTRIGSIAWVTTVQFFIVQLVAASAWKSPFSLRRNAISDLGNTACSIYDGRYVCSPLHNQMNASFILLGLAMIIGAYAFYHTQAHATMQKLSFILIGLGGFGSMLVGVAPENLLPLAHTIGATLPFGLGNIGLLLAGLYWVTSPKLRLFTIILGTAALVAVPLFLTKTYLGLGLGGMERIVAYPQTIWFMTIGSYFLYQKYQSREL